MKLTAKIKSHLFSLTTALFLVVFVLGSLQAQQAEPKIAEKTEQTSEESSPNEIEALTEGTRIWSGTAYFSRNKRFQGTGEGNYREDIGMFLGADVDYIRLLNADWGIGINGFFETFFSEKFNSSTLIYVGAGPVVRRYLWQKNRIKTYAQANILLGYDMALGEAYGGSSNSEFRYRTGVRVGASYRLSNEVGIFMDIGPDWEGDDGGFDTKGIQLNIGIRLFRF